MRILTWNIHGARDAPLSRIAEEIRAQSPDVVCLNEVRRRHGERLGRLLGMQAFVAASCIGPFGNVICTSGTVSAWRRLRFAGVRRTERRDATIVTLASGVTVAAIHLGLRAPERLRHVSELLAAVSDPAVVAGDANENPHRDVWQTFAARFDDACGETSAPTFPVGEPRDRIDYVWVPRGARVLRCAVVQTSASDHLPVVVDLDLPPRA